MVRAKFVCVSKGTEKHSKDAEPQGVVKLQAVYGTGNDNQQWSKYTPSGTLEMRITNPPALDEFEPGEEYYIDIYIQKSWKK